MPIALITGSSGLIGSEAASFFAEKGFEIIGIDNDLRSYFFGNEASTLWKQNELKVNIPKYTHYSIDIRDVSLLEKVFTRYGREIEVVIHCAAQPSHDWAAKEPFTDFTVNANGTLNLLELSRKYCPETVFIFTSTNKVYGDRPNLLPFIEQETRWEISSDHHYYKYGIDESLTIDQSIHSLFGASKAAADLLVQEYGRYFGMKTGSFRGGCLTGSSHSGAQLHGFLSYLVKCAIQEIPYKIFGYKGKQVRDNIHSFDLVNAFWHFFKNPRFGEIYNLGGSRHSNCSMLEAIMITEKLTQKKIRYEYIDSPRKGDHIWWISDVRKFQSHFPDWTYRYNIEDILKEIATGLTDRFQESHLRVSCT